MGQQMARDLLVQVGARLSFVGTVQIMCILFLLKKTVNRFIEDIILYNMIIWGLC